MQAFLNTTMTLFARGEIKTMLFSEETKLENPGNDLELLYI